MVILPGIRVIVRGFLCIVRGFLRHLSKKFYVHVLAQCALFPGVLHYFSTFFNRICLESHTFGSIEFLANHIPYLFD